MPNIIISDNCPTCGKISYVVLGDPKTLEDQDIEYNGQRCPYCGKEWTYPSADAVEWEGGPKILQAVKKEALQ